MSDSKDRLELEQRLDQARRMAAEAFDPVTKERLQGLVRDLAEQLRARAGQDSRQPDES
jgi:hypothetical protein